MHTILAFILSTIFSITLAWADPVEWEPINSASQDSSYENQRGSHPYESTSGTRYKYDLANPADRVRYESDPAAQVLDQANPRVGLDRSMGNYGGGAER